MRNNLEINDCKFFLNCNAPICPVDPDWKKRSHLNGERVCYYLIEYAKEGARPILKAALSTEMYSRIAEVYPQVVDQVGPVRRKLKSSSKNPPRVKYATKGDG